MARGFKHGSGGSALNFRVTAGAAMPQDPGENTIFVETGAPMSRWAFAGVDPGPVEEGLVWIVTGQVSAGDFHALAGEAILLVSPLRAMQYVSGAWAEKNAWIYKLGAWVPLEEGDSETLLYDAGNQYPALTGGWTGELWTYNAYGMAEGTVSDTCLEITGGHTGSAGKACAVGTAQRLSLAGVQRLWAEVQVLQSGLVTFGVCSGRDTGSMAASVTVQTLGNHSLCVDTGDLEGEYYVAAVAFGSQAAGTSPKARITRIRMEEST